MRCGALTRTIDQAMPASIDKMQRRLQVSAAFAIAAYEDVFYYLWKERKLPVNVDPLDPKLADPIERVRVARIFEKGLDVVLR